MSTVGEKFLQYFSDRLSIFRLMYAIGAGILDFWWYEYVIRKAGMGESVWGSSSCGGRVSEE